jgi:hypothetical protein
VITIGLAFAVPSVAVVLYLVIAVILVVPIRGVAQLISGTQPE